MKKLFITILTVTLLFCLTACYSSTVEKNIYHSQWESAEGYVLLINDPIKNPNISKPMCAVKMGGQALGSCGVTFDKNNGTATITWVYYKSFTNYISGGATISNDTKSFYLDKIKFTFEGTIE